MTLKSAIKAQAKRQGFQLVGVTTPDPPPNINIYKKWLRAGRHGEMNYLASERAIKRRSDPRSILPECRSILVLGIRYPAQRHVEEQQGGNANPKTNPQGQMASYSWGTDYHDVLPERLRELVGFIEAQTGHSVANRWYTDTGPILERDFAQRAGLGWIGKNTCLIACILPDRTIDARRCISYLTIELKGAIPVELRPNIGSWVFGCDVCQQVCPWNQRFASTETDPAFAPRPNGISPELNHELSLSPEAFNLKFRDSPVKRTRRRGYLRNVAVVLGNSRDLSAVPILARSLMSDIEPLVRAHCAWALGQIGGERAKEALILSKKTEQDGQVIAEIESALEFLIKS
jgi:epoxyqueuosine reductase